MALPPKTPTNPEGLAVAWIIFTRDPATGAETVVKRFEAKTDGYLDRMKAYEKAKAFAARGMKNAKSPAEWYWITAE